MKRLLRTEEAAEYLALEPGTLENWRYRSEGPPVVRLGKAVRYDLKDLDAWIEAQKGAA